MRKTMPKPYGSGLHENCLCWVCIPPAPGMDSTILTWEVLPSRGGSPQTISNYSISSWEGSRDVVKLSDQFALTWSAPDIRSTDSSSIEQGRSRLPNKDSGIPFAPSDILVAFFVGTALGTLFGFITQWITHSPLIAIGVSTIFGFFGALFYFATTLWIRK